MFISLKKIFSVFLFTLLCWGSISARNSIPQLIKKEDAFQLLVNGKPFIMLGGELGNSATSDAQEMRPIWPKLKSMHLNTVLAPVYWELMEPQEGKFDFSLVDSMIVQARSANLKLVFLWFGTWKNSMSCYTPEWVKKDCKRFPRTLDRNGKPSEIVSAFSKNILESDCRAFSRLMEHIKQIDADQQTVVMIQVENEIGQLPEARDYSALANSYYQQEVPTELLAYLTKNKINILPYLSNLWTKNGCKTTGNWETVFGKSLVTDELFTAWYYAVFANKVAAAGKAVYALPMYVNCALNRPNVDPGKYPSGGPLPHLLDVWRAAGHSIDMLSPDVYHGDFRHWLQCYDTSWNPVFLPEIKLETENAAQVFYTLGVHKALGYCPFSIESANEAEATALGKSYKVLSDVSELLLKDRTKVNGCYLDKQHPTDTLMMGDYQLVVSHVCILPWTDGAKAEKWTPAGCVIIETATDEFWIAGTSVTCTFKNRKDKSVTTGILSADVVVKNENEWKYIRLNGDQTHQGRHMRMGSNEWQIQRIRLYDYR